MDEKVATVPRPSVGLGTTTDNTRELFESLKAEWQEQSRHVSHEAQIVMFQPYQRIIGMGWPVVPFILEELRPEPDHWFWALQAITGENLVTPEIAGNVPLMAQAWVEWGAMHAADHECAADELRQRFSALAAEWKEKARYLSNNVQIARLMCYQHIIGMGWPAVPLILEELGRQPRQWFWALEAITGENPVPAKIAGYVALSAQAWVDWGKGKGLIAR